MDLDNILLNYVKKGGSLGNIPVDLRTKKICEEAVANSGKATEYVPREILTEEMCIEAIRNSNSRGVSQILRCIPQEMLTEKIYIEAVKMTSKVLKIIPKEKFTEKIWLEAAKIDDIDWNYIPKEKLTEEICVELCRKRDYVNLKFLIEYIPDRMKTEKFYKNAVKVNGDILQYIPKKILTKEMCLDAVKNSKNVFKYVPKKLLTTEICLEAVKNSEDAFQYVPKEMRTKEIYIEEFKYSTNCFKEIPEEMLTEEIYIEAVKQNRFILKDFPQEKLTPKILLEVVKRWPVAIINDIPEKLLTKEMYLEAIKYENDEMVFKSGLLKYVPKRKQTKEMCLLAVKTLPECLKYVSKKFQIEEVYIEALRNNVKALDFIPEEKLTKEIYMEALKNNVKALSLLRYIPKKILTKEMCLEAIKNDIKTLTPSLSELKIFDFIPKKMLTEEMCIETIKNNYYAIKYIPKEMLTEKMCLEAVKKSYIVWDWLPEEMKNEKVCIELLKKGMENVSWINLVTIDIVKKFENSLKVNIAVAEGGGADKEDIETIIKADKFEKAHKFIPIWQVIKKWPENKIEKFDKKIWWYLTKNELYNQNDDTKSALIEAALTLGVFEKGEGQEERIGFLEHMATYLPKKEITLTRHKISQGSRELFEKNFKILEDTKYLTLQERDLLKDSNFKDLFNSEEEAIKEMKKLPIKITSKEIEKRLEKIEKNSDYYQIMKYIFDKGYEQISQSIKMVLTTDIQAEKNVNKKEGLKLENEIREIYNEANPEFMMTPEKLHRIFDGMDMEYDSEFFEFFKNNYRELLTNVDMQTNFSKIQRQWKSINEAFLGQRITYEKCKSYIYSHRYTDVNYQEVAKLASNCGYSQSDFEAVEKIYDKQKERSVSSIPQIEGINKKSGYIYKVLRLDDPSTMFVGELTDCCQAINNAGESCMVHSATSTNGRVLVVIDKGGKVLSQSWIWRNKNVLCFDNIEAVKKDSENKKVVSSEILETIKQAAKEFINVDKIGMLGYKSRKIEELEENKKSGQISESEYEKEIKEIDNEILGQQLNKVTVGIGYTDVDLSGLKYDDENKYPEEDVAYIADSRKQLILCEDNSVKHIDTNNKTIALYEDGEDVEPLINIDVSEIQKNIDEEYEYNEEYDLDFNHNVAYNEEHEEYETEIDRESELVFSALEDKHSENMITLDKIKEAIDIHRKNAQASLENIKKINEEEKITEL